MNIVLQIVQRAHEYQKKKKSYFKHENVVKSMKFH